MISRRVSWAFVGAFGLAVIAFVGIDREAVRRSFELARTAELREGLEAARSMGREAFENRRRQGRSTVDIERRARAVDRGLLVVAELDVFHEDLALWVAALGAAPFALVFVVFGTFSVLWLRRLLRPIDAMAAAARRFAAGDTGGFPIGDRGTGDVRALGHALDEMVTTIRRQAATIAAQGRSLGWRDVAREVVHESKTLLTPVRLAAEGIVEGAGGPAGEPLRRDAERILAGLRAIERMNASLRDLANRRLARIEPVALHPLLGVLADLHARAGRVDVRVDGEPVALGDADLLREALSNLVVNAFEAKATTVELVAGRVDDGVFVECADDGPGIATSDRAKVGRLGFTTKEGGTGFGLYFAEKLALELGGRLEVGEAGPGARVRMVLPDGDAAHRR